MNRRDALRLLALSGTGLLARRFVNAQGATLTLQPLTDKLSVLMGDGGNMTVLRSGDGLLVVDSGLPNLAGAAVGKLKEVAPLPVKTLINTHWHSDHTGGNVEFGQAGAMIIADEATLKRVSTPQHMMFMNRDVQPLAPEGLPKSVFRTEGHLSFGGETVAYERRPAAHTDGDSTVHFENSNVFCTGDLLFSGMYPFIDYSSGGSIEGTIGNAALMAKIVDSETKVVPGHGPLATRAHLISFHDMLSEVNGSVSDLIKQGKTVEEVIAAGPTNKYDEKYGKGFMNPTSFVKMLYQGKTMAARPTV